MPNWPKIPERESIDQYKASLGPLQEYIPGLDKTIAGNEHHGRCPFCLELGDPNSPCFWVWGESQRYTCRKCGVKGDIIDYVEHTTGRGLAEQLRDAGFLEDKDEIPVRKKPTKEEKGEPVRLAEQAEGDHGKPVKGKPVKGKPVEGEPVEGEPARLTEDQKKMKFLWSKCKQSPIPYSDYLKNGRGIDLGTTMSPAILWNSYQKKGAAEKTEMVVMPLTKPGDPPISQKTVPQSIMRIWLKREGYKLTKDPQWKPMAQNWTPRAQSGRAVWFFPDMDKKKVGHGEGQETMLAVFAATGMNVAASLTTAGINNISFFPEQKEVFFFVDQDAPKWSQKSGKQIGCGGQKSGLKAALRAEKKGLKAWVVTPSNLTFSDDYGRIKKVDFNDLLVDDPTGESIRARLECAVRPSEIKWTPPADKKVEGSLVDEDGNLIPQNHAAIALSEMSRGLFASSVMETWRQFNGASWEPCEKGEFHEHIVQLMDQHTGGTGYNTNYMFGAIKLMQCSGRLKLSDKAQNKVPFQNGMLDLKTMEFIETTAENAMQWHLPFDYNDTEAEADCPFFIKWLNDVCDDPSGDTQWFIRANFNACLVERDDLPYFVHFKGRPGTGKGTIIKIMESIVGQGNYASSDFRVLAKSQFETRRFLNKRLLIFNEVPHHIDIQTFLNLSGRDGVRYERKGKNDDLSFVYKGVIALTSNEFFTTNDQTSAALERRRRTVIFDKVFTEEQKKDWSDNGGFEQILAEMPEIIKWALEMTRAEVSDAFHSPPKLVSLANQQAEKAASPLIDFIINNVEYQEGSYVHIGVKKEVNEYGEKTFVGADVRLYPRYLAWCSNEGRKRSLSKAKFLAATLNYINSKIKPDGAPDAFQSKQKKYGGYPVINIKLTAAISLDTELDSQVDVGSRASNRVSLQSGGGQHGGSQQGGGQKEIPWNNQF